MESLQHRFYPAFAVVQGVILEHAPVSRNIGWCAQGRHSTANAIINIALSPRVLDSTVIVSRCGSGGETVARDRGALTGGATSLIVLACTSIKCFECPSGIVYLWLEVWVILFKFHGTHQVERFRNPNGDTKSGCVHPSDRDTVYVQEQGMAKQIFCLEN